MPAEERSSPSGAGRYDAGTGAGTGDGSGPPGGGGVVPADPRRATASGPAPYPEAATAEYTAQGSRLPPPGEAPPVQGSTARRTHRRRARRPGPSAKVAVPVLFLALACYAVGFWALTRI